MNFSIPSILNFKEPEITMKTVLTDLKEKKAPSLSCAMSDLWAAVKLRMRAAT